MRGVGVCLAVLALYPGTPAGAQTVSLTEAEMLAQVEASAHPRVESARAAGDLLRSDVLAAARWPNPRASITREAAAGTSEYYATVAQTLPVTGRRRLDVTAATARAAAADDRAGEERRRLRAEARRAFADLVAAQARERELAEVRDRLQALVETLARREAAGDAAGFDRIRAEREVLELDADRAAAAVARAGAQAALWGVLTTPSAASALVAVPVSQSSPPLPALDQLVAAAERRPAIAALRHEVDAAEAAGRAATRRAVPEPEVIAGTKSSTAAGGDVGGIVGLHITVPLFDRAQPERAAAAARLRQARAELEAARRALRADLESRHAAAVGLRDIAARYRDMAGATAGEIARIAQLSYDDGERGILELLDAYRTASSTRLRQVDLDAAVRIAEIELEFTSGWELP